VFEGPLDLLLHLVKINEMDVYDIRLSTVTDQYLEYVHAMKQLDLEAVGDYLVMAATLLNIKSRALLPRNAEDEELAPEEEIDEILSTQELIRRLVEFRRFKELAQSLRRVEEEHSRLFYRQNMMTSIPGSEAELPRQDILALFDAFARVLKKVRVDREHQVVGELFSVEDKVTEIREKLKLHRQINFSRVFETCTHRQEVICYFLAILELSKLREITLAQAANFEDILVESWDEEVFTGG
jgi:segregation and condensation protein A